MVTVTELFVYAVVMKTPFGESLRNRRSLNPTPPSRPGPPGSG
jgi:hypothetical protein